MKKLFGAFIAAIFLTGSVSSVNAADVPDEQWSILNGWMEKSADRTGVQLLGISIEDNSNLSERASNIVGRDLSIGGELGLRLCKTIESEYCTPGQAQYLYAILPVCLTDSDQNCISAVTAIKNGIEIKGEYKRNFPTKGYTDFPANKDRNIPQGSTPSTWTFNGLTHSGGNNEYLVNFGVQASFNPQGVAQFDSYNANINPVSIKAGAWARNEVKDASDKKAPCSANCGMELVGHSSNDKFVCASLDEGFCAMRETFPPNVRFRVEARLSQSPTGWLHGRLKAPVVDIRPLATGVSISIEAEPVTVPVVGILEPKSKLPAALVEKYGNASALVWSTSNAPVEASNHLVMPQPDTQKAFDALVDWKDFIKDRANASPTEWAVRTLSDFGQNAQCLKSSTQLVGIVTTNSMVYLGSPPVFENETQSLNYKVASPHYTSNGEVFKGTYDLQLKSDVARCLYGFGSAPISAKIEIVSESGQPNVATTVVNEKNGWLRMAAYGFTFSSPTIKVKLSQEAPAADSKPLPDSGKTTVICIKGKSSKKVTAIKPICPAGYKKK